MLGLDYCIKRRWKEDVTYRFPASLSFLSPQGGEGGNQIRCSCRNRSAQPSKGYYRRVQGCHLRAGLRALTNN